MGAGKAAADLVRGDGGRVQDIAAYGHFVTTLEVSIPRMATKEIGRGNTMATAYARWQREELVVRHPDSMARDTAQAIVLSVARAGRLPEHPRGTPGAFRGYRPRLWVGRYAGPEGSYVLVLVGDVVHIGGHAASGP